MIKLRIPWVTLTIIGLQIWAFWWEWNSLKLGILRYVLDDYGFSWQKFLMNWRNEAPTIVTHTFLHGNLEHIVTNIIFFLLFGPAVELYFGRFYFLVSYLLWAIAAVFSQIFFSPFGGNLIGSSGAISGAAGAFFVLYPLRMPTGFFGHWIQERPFSFFAQVLQWVSRVPAFFYIGLWFVTQLQQGWESVMPAALSGRVSLIAYWAHVGGFVAGAFSAAPFLLFRKSETVFLRQTK